MKRESFLDNDNFKENIVAKNAFCKKKEVACTLELIQDKDCEDGHIQKRLTFMLSRSLLDNNHPHCPRSIVKRSIIIHSNK